MTLSRTNSKEESGKWMSCPKNYCEFPGLAYLYEQNQLIVAQKLDKLHNIIEKHDVSYTVYNNLGEKVFIGTQKNQLTQFQIKLYNIYGNEVIHMKKSNKCIINKVLVWAPPDYFVGSVDKAIFQNRYEVRNGQGVMVLEVKKLYPRDLVYSVVVEGQEVGTVMKDWAKNPHDNYMVSFPRDLGVGLKTVMLGACFLIMQK